MKTSPTTIRFTEEAKRLLKALAKSKGISGAAVLELLIRDEAKRQKLK